MKPSNTPDPKMKDAYDKLIEFFTPQEIESLISTMLGMSAILGKHLLESNPLKYPTDVKYALVQIGQVTALISNVLKGKTRNDSFPYIPGYIPHDASFEERYKFVVKAYYENLKARGEI